VAKLFLGVENLAYSDPDVKGVTTTGEVADILEKKYNVMDVFFELYGKKIADDIAKSMIDDMDALMHGEMVSTVPMAGAMQKIEHSFRNYLDADEWQQTTGQAIAAAQNGVSHRFKSVRGVAAKQRGPRPAFIDTGLYQSSFRAWVKL
jgi:hypothetical protein